jgi:hypothetical protein
MTDCDELSELFIRVLKQIKWIGNGLHSVKGLQSSTQAYYFFLVGYFMKLNRLFRHRDKCSYYLTTCFGPDKSSPGDTLEICK